MRLDQYVAQYWPEHSRSQWQKHIANGYVYVNKQPELSSKYEMSEDDEVKIHMPRPIVYEQELPIVYEDDNVLVINKPSGILTHSKGAVNEEFTVADYVKSKTTDGADGNRPGIVHRLDRDTSGILIAAKNTETKHLLQKQFQDRKAKKTYYAIVRGVPRQPEANIDLPLGRDPKAPSRFRVDPSGKPAQTHYKVLETKGVYTLLELKPITGRTHQLRVHLSYIGVPIAGDIWYGGGKSPIGRLCLHAKSLEITIPTSDRRVFEAPLPEDFATWVQQ
jgi:23S rRNA pseudouridine1911/1915/1917 synthase